MVVDADLAHECTKVVKVLVSDSCLFTGLSLNLSELGLLIWLLIRDLGKL